MQNILPDVIKTYINASNERDIDTFISLFTNDAIVHDEGEEHRGLAAIRDWFTSTVAKYNFTLVPGDSTSDGTETILALKMSGEFPGSPVDAKFHFKLNNHRIVKLSVR